MTINERLAYFIKYQKIKQIKFAEKSGTIQGWIDGVVGKC